MTTTTLNAREERNRIATEKLEETNSFLFELYENPESFRKWVNIQYGLHKYSATNRAFLLYQNENVTHVGTFNSWKKLGYSINKGAKSLKVFVPILVELYRSEDGKWKNVNTASNEVKAKILKNFYETKKQKTGFRLASVFDVKDTTAIEADFREVINLPDLRSVVELVARHTSSPVPDCETEFEQLETLVRDEVERDITVSREAIEAISETSGTSVFTIREALVDIETAFILTKVHLNDSSLNKNLIEPLHWRKDDENHRKAIQKLHDLACKKSDELWNEFQYVFKTPSTSRCEERA